jgi:hypothetical protein
MNSVTTRLGCAAISAALLLLTACAANFVRTPVSDDYYPALKKGQEWEYSLEYKTPSAGVQKGSILVRVDGVEEINNKDYFRTVTSFSGVTNLDASLIYYRRSPQGIHKIYGRHINAPEFVEIPFPLAVGESWTVDDPDGTLQYTADGIESVTTPDRTYPNCLKVSFKSQNSSVGYEGYSYHAPGIGEVKAVMKLNGSTVEYVLRDYRTLASR